MGLFARLAESAGVPPTRLMADFAALALSPGHPSVADYERLRLYDEAFWAGADRRGVVGARRGREIALQVNFRHDWFGLAANRLAWSAYLAAHGLPVIPIEAIFCRGLATPSARVLRTREELRDFLAASAGRPLVGRPAEGGVATAIVGAAPLAVEHLIEMVCETHAGGYLFQPLIGPHRAVTGVSGGHLAPVRLLTMAAGAEPRVIRALWDLPGAAGISLDLRTGQAMHLSVRSPLAGLKAAQWEALKATAVEGARVLRHLPLLGWDVAAGEDGPVIVGLTPTPDFAAHQIADRRGLLDADFLSYLETQRHLAAEHAGQVKAETAWL